MLGNLLKGLHILDLTQNVAGPFCTQILGDFGADVIKVERLGRGDDTRSWLPPEIEGQSATFLALNRSKKSICVNLDSEDGINLIRKLALTADVVIHSMKPGSAESRGLGPEQLRELNPRLIYCAISAFGETGPLSHLPGYDPLMQAFTGIMAVTGNSEDDPVRVSVSLIDMGTGMWAALGIFAAVMSRQQTGQGMLVNASLLETGMSWMTIFIASYLASGQLPEKLGSAMSMAAPYQLFPSRDGHVFIAAGNDELFAKVCRALECFELLDDPRFKYNFDRVKNRQSLVEAISNYTRQRNTQDLVHDLRAAGAPCSELNTIAQALNHEQVRALGIVDDVDDSNIRGLKAVGLPLRINGQRAGRISPPPMLAADTDAVLAAFGINEDERLMLRNAGAIA